MTTTDEQFVTKLKKKYEPCPKDAIVAIQSKSGRICVDCRSDIEQSKRPSTGEAGWLCLCGWSPSVKVISVTPSERRRLARCEFNP